MSVNFLWYFFKVWVKVYSSKGFPFAFIRHSTIPPPQYYYKPNSHLFFVLWNHTSAYQFKLQNSIPGLCFECSGMDFGNFFFPSHPNLKWKVSSPSPFAGWIFSHLVFFWAVFLPPLRSLRCSLSYQVWKWQIQRTSSQFTGRFPQHNLCLQGTYLLL